MSQKDSANAASKLEPTKREALDVELGLELDSCRFNTDNEDDPKSLYHHHQSPLHVRGIKRMDGRPVSAEVNYDQTSRKLLIYTFSAAAGGDDVESSAKVERRIPESDLYLRRQSTPEAFGGTRSGAVIGGRRTKDLSTEPEELELAEREVVWEKRKSYEGGCGGGRVGGVGVGDGGGGRVGGVGVGSSGGGDGARKDDAGGRAVYSNLTWSDIMDEGDKATGENSSSSLSQRQKVGETFTTRFVEMERRDPERATKQTENPMQGDQFYDNDERRCTEGIGGLQSNLNRGDIVEGSRWNGGNLQETLAFRETGSRLPSVVLANDLQSKTHEDMLRLWPSKSKWMVPGGDDRKPSTPHRILDHETNSETWTKSIENSEAERRWKPSFPHDSNIRRRFWNENLKSSTTTEEVCKSEGSLEGMGMRRSKGSLRQWRVDSTNHADADADVRQSSSVDIGVPLRIEIPEEHVTHRQPTKERRNNEILRSSTTAYLNLRKPEVIREGLALQTNFTGTGFSRRSFNVHSNNRFSDTTRTGESCNTETSSSKDRTDGGGSQLNNSLLVARRKPLEFQNSHQRRYGSLRDADAAGSLQRIAISLEDNLDAKQKGIANNYDTPTLPQTNQERLEERALSKPRTNETSRMNEQSSKNRVPSLTIVNLSLSKPFLTQSNLTGLPDTREERRHIESTSPAHRSSQDGLESSNSTQHQLFHDRRFQIESKIQDYRQTDVCERELPSVYHPLQDRSCSVPIIQNHPTKENFFQENFFDSRHQPGSQNECYLSSCDQPFKRSWTSDSSMIRPADDLQATRNTLAPNQTILEYSSSKDLKSSDSERSFVQSADYIASNSPRMMVFSPKCSLGQVGVPTEEVRPRQDKSHRKSLPLVFYNSRYKEMEETTESLTSEFNSGKESETWMQSSGTGDSSWRSFPGIQVEREDQRVADECRQVASLDHSTEKKPPKPKLEMTRQSQPGDWHYNTIYEPDTPSPSNEIPPTTKDITEQEYHDATGMAGQPDSQWNSLPSLLDTSEDLHRDEGERGTFQKSISSDRIHTRIWVPTNRGHRSQQTSTTGNRPTDENLPHSQTTTTETPGTSAWVDLREDAENGFHSDKCKTVYNREIKQIPSVASHTFRNTKRQFVSLGGKTQRDSASQTAVKTDVKEKVFGKNADVTKAGTNDFTQDAKCSDSSLCSVDNTKMEREWKSAEVLVRKEQSQQNRTPKINQLRHSTSDSCEDGEPKPRSVHRPIIIQHEGKTNSAHLVKTKRVETEAVGPSRPSVPSPPSSQTNETSGAKIKLGSTEIPTSDLSNDKAVQQTIDFRPGDTKPNKDSSRSNHLPQIDITTIKARVFRLTDDNGTTEFSTASNQLDKSEGLRDKLSTKVHVKDQHTLNLDRDVLHGHEIPAQDGGGVKSFIQSKTFSSSGDQTSDQTTKRLEDLGMDETFKDVDYELSRLMKIDGPEPESKNSKTKRSVVQPLSSANLSLLDPSRTNEWRNTSLEYAKQWLDSTAQCNKSIVNVDNHFFCDEKFLSADVGSTSAAPQKDAENVSCGYDAKVLDSILQDIATGENERSYSDGVGMSEHSKTCDLTTSNIRPPSKARSRDLLTEHALGISVAATRPTQLLQVYLIGDEKSLAFSNRISQSRRQTNGTELGDGHQSRPQKLHTQNHDSVMKSRGGSARELPATIGNTHMSNRSLSSSMQTKCEVADHKSSSTNESVKEHRPRPHVSSANHQPHIFRQEDDVSAAKLRGFHPEEEDFSGRLRTDESKKTDIYLAPRDATDEAKTEDGKRSEKPRDSDARSNHQQGRILTSDPTRSDKVSEKSSCDPADSKLFHEMTLEWSPAKGNLLTASKTPEQCFVCSRTAKLPDIPSLQYYKLSHRCLRSSMQHVDSSTTRHSMFLINSRSETSLREMGNISRSVSERHCALVPVHGSSVPVHGSSAPVHGSSVPVSGSSVPVRGSSVPVQGSSVSVQRNSRRSLSAVDAPSVRGGHPISGRLTNVSDPCLSTTTASAELQSVHPIGHSATGIRHHALRKDEQGLLTPQCKVFREHKTTNETHANMPWTEPRMRYLIPNRQSSGQSLTQSSVGDSQVRLGQAPLKPSRLDRMAFNADGRADTNRTSFNFVSQAQDNSINQSLRIYLAHLHDPYSDEVNYQDRSDTELTDNTDVSLDGLMLRPDEAAGNSPSVDPFEYSDMEAIFPTTDISTFVFENFQRDQNSNSTRDNTGQDSNYFTSAGQTEIGMRGMNHHHGSHHGVSEMQKPSHYGEHKKPGSFANVVTRKSEISRQNDVSVIPGQLGQGTGFTTKETRVETMVDLLRDSETAGDRTTSGVLWGNKLTDDRPIISPEDHSERDPRDMVASFNDLVNPFMKPTKDGKNSVGTNSESHSIAQLHAQQSTAVFPSSSVLPSGRVKYRKLSQHISNLVPSYNASPCASNNNNNSNAHSNQDRV